MFVWSILLGNFIIPSIKFLFVSEKYCPLVIKEGGKTMLQHLLDNDEISHPLIHKLANTVIKNCESYQTPAPSRMDIDPCSEIFNYHVS